MTVIYFANSYSKNELIMKENKSIYKTKKEKYFMCLYFASIKRKKNNDSLLFKVTKQRSYMRIIKLLSLQYSYMVKLVSKSYTFMSIIHIEVSTTFSTIVLKDKYYIFSFN